VDFRIFQVGAKTLTGRDIASSRAIQLASLGADSGDNSMSYTDRRAFLGGLAFGAAGLPVRRLSLPRRRHAAGYELPPSAITLP